MKFSLAFLLMISSVNACEFSYINYGEQLLFECKEKGQKIKTIEKDKKLYTLNNVLLDDNIQAQYTRWKKGLSSLESDLRGQEKRFKFNCR